MPIAQLDRTILSLSGEGVEPFLLGLTTNNLNAELSFQALLTPQGKIIADFFVTKTENGLLLDTAAKFGPALMKRLKMYKLRAKFDLADVSDSRFVYVLWDGQGEEGRVDPRYEALGRRLITSLPLETNASPADYNAHRLALGVPESSWDFGSSERFPADMNMDLLSGVDYQKGCFVGQEVVSRMHRKGSVRKRVCGFSGQAQAGDSLWQRAQVDEQNPDQQIDQNPDQQIEVKVGDVLSCFDKAGMAVMRIDKVDFDAPVYVKGGEPLCVRPPLYAPLKQDLS